VIVGIIDVGSNSIRLLVAEVRRAREVRQLRRERVYVRLGDDAYRYGAIRDGKLDETSAVATRFSRMAYEAGAARVQTIVTAPARQASNPEALVRVLTVATRAPVVLLSAEDEGCLAWEGAVSRLDEPPKRIGVVDLGGGSCEIAIGGRSTGPRWVRSFEAGALRITRAFLEQDPPRPRDVARARKEVARLVDVDRPPPRPDVMLAVGGTARAVSRVLGRRFGADELEELSDRLARLSSKKIADRFDVTAPRAQTLLAGTLVLTRTARLVGTDLELGRGGLREGAALALAGAEAVAA
jgi:exopolyphosphatase / guanosine-5'-triphosphate,3'-diphosphate pyrophosphatase